MRGVYLLRGIGVTVAVISYAVLAYESALAPKGHGLGIVLAFGPLLILAVSFSWRATHRYTWLLLCALACFLAYRYWPVLTQNVVWVSLIEQTSVCTFLAAIFAGSLVAGREPLCTRWATVVHGPLPAAVARYTRRVTVAWTVFFVLMSVTLIVLFVFAPLQLWSAFANFCAVPLVAAMFVGEYMVRGRVLPDMQHASILEGLRAYMDYSRGTAAPRRR